MTDRGDYTLELDSWLRSQEATERIVSEARHKIEVGGDDPRLRGSADTLAADTGLRGREVAAPSPTSSTDLQVALPAVDVSEEGM